MAIDPVTPARCCLECGQSFPAGERRLYCPTCAREPTVADAIWATLGFALLAVVVACFVAFVFAPPTVFADSDLPRWAVVKWQHGTPTMATFEARSEAECKDIASKRTAAYAHAGVAAQWTCVDLATAGDRGA